MSTTTEEKHKEVLSESDVSLRNESIPDKKSIDDDSDSPPPERPTKLFVGSKYDAISVKYESLGNERYCKSKQVFFIFPSASERFILFVYFEGFVGRIFFFEILIFYYVFITSHTYGSLIVGG